jgi:hypothetical protein
VEILDHVQPRWGQPRVQEIESGGDIRHTVRTIVEHHIRHTELVMHAQQEGLITLIANPDGDLSSSTSILE